MTIPEDIQAAAREYLREGRSAVYAFNKLLAIFPDVHSNTIAGYVTDVYGPEAI